MSDLISRSDLKKEIESIYLHVSGVRSGKGILAKCMDSYKKAVLDIINNQPTVYDVEKVVAELKDNCDIYSVKYYQENVDVKAVQIDDAIDIVRKGGIE